jgi:hypothetical protein
MNVNQNEAQQQQQEEQQEPDLDVLDSDNNMHVPEMNQVFMHLGLSPIAAQEFINNGITTPGELRTLESEDLNHLIKQTLRDDMNGLFIPYKAQQSLHVIQYWMNCQYILGMAYSTDLIARQLMTEWIRKMKDEKEEKEVTKATADLFKAPKAFKKGTK